MKKIFVLMALSSFSLLSADRFMCRGCCCDNFSDGWGYGGYSQDFSHDHVSWGSGEVQVDYQPQCEVYASQPMGDTYGQPSHVQSYGQNPGFQQRQYGRVHMMERNDDERGASGLQGRLPGFQRVGDALQFSDQEIARKIQDALNSGKSNKDLFFRVDRGIVIVRGQVEDADYRTKVEDAVKKIEGVKHVDIQVGVVPAKSADADNKDTASKADSKFPDDFGATDADKRLNAKIRDKLNGGWFSRGYEGLVVRTNNGIVIISGTVATQDEADKLPEQLRGIEGLRKVNVQVAVRKK